MINKDRLIKTFIELVKIDSPSGEEDELAQDLKKKLKALGAISIKEDSFGNVIAQFKGQGQPIMLNAHMDTVEPGRGIKPIVKGDLIKTDGSTVLGGDPKSGVVAILEALESIKEDKMKCLPIDVVLTRSEESGCLGAANLDYSLLRAKRGVTFDGGEEVHKVNISAPGISKVEIKITGRSAHGGAEPEKGISSIRIASEIISLLQLGRIDPETTSNIGMIEGGAAPNSVPELTSFKGDVRSRDKAKLEKLEKHYLGTINRVMKRFPEAKVEININREFDPYHFDSDHPALLNVSEAFRAIGIEPELIPSGGGTDVNIFHTHGIEAIVVGDGDYNAHTTREYVVISQILEAAKFAQELVTYKKL